MQATCVIVHILAATFNKKKNSIFYLSDIPKMSSFPHVIEIEIILHLFFLYFDTLKFCVYFTLNSTSQFI